MNSNESNKMCDIFVPIIDAKRDSFSHRIYDDLCEDLLQWLSIEEKIKLIGVSQQFKRCLEIVWLRQKVLSLEDTNSGEYNSIECYKMISKMSFLKFNSCDLESVLKTFPNINEIIALKGATIFDTRLLNSIINNLNNLRSFHTNLQYMSPAILIKLVQKFGPTLKSLVIYVESVVYNFTLNKLLVLCTSLESLDFFGKENSNFTVFGFLELFKNPVKCMQKLNSNITWHSNEFEVIIKNYPNLTVLDISIDNYPSKIMGKIAQLRELRRLRIFLIDNIQFTKRFAKSIEFIGKCCTKLQVFYFEVFLRKSFNTKLFFNGLKYFTTLKNFQFFSINYENILDKIYDLNINSIENCKQMTYLKLTSDIIPKEFLNEIHLVFANLKVLYIDIEDELTDTQLKSISNLKYLKKLFIYSLKSRPMKHITDSGILSLIIGCKNFNYLRIESFISITELLFEVIIEKALQMPTIHFTYHLHRIITDPWIDPSINIWDKYSILENVDFYGFGCSLHRQLFI